MRRDRAGRSNHVDWLNAASKRCDHRAGQPDTFGEDEPLTCYVRVLRVRCTLGAQRIIAIVSDILFLSLEGGALIERSYSDVHFQSGRIFSILVDQWLHFMRDIDMIDLRDENAVASNLNDLLDRTKKIGLSVL